MKPPDAEARTLARAFLEQTLSAEGNALMLEHATREEIVRGLTAARRRARSGIAAAADGDGAPAEAGTSPDPAVTGPMIGEAPDLASLAALVAACSRCTLHQSRKNPVFGEGAANARVVCVGEAPGKHEDETGRPFVGRAGRLLDRLLLSIGLPRESVYICNVLKSRPPRNRDPLPEEVAACSPYLVRQLALIEPEVIIAFGAFAARTLLETKSALGRLRGSVHRYAGYPVVATYHPAALLRNPGWVRPTWEDLQMVRRMLDGVEDREARLG
ncbi:MAG: uracil-DNA glycosylase [Gemmatimonadota bacterium]|uniref:uracil-DNA glycosylase n=1 Tax=Candidatus Palauibacter scopulicola TaxID=3056741 RepID=UPI002396A4F3|nr:uracil-DNA glycosylase [Candidatus Palauibacter scopulicola]MDE2662953.1 uracil-DNA glycosylase [Candidatus Palauibacter scopulicola]